MPRGHRNQRRKHPAVPTPNSERHYVDDSQTGLWLPTSKQRSAMNLKSEKEKFYYVMWSLIHSSVSRLNECDKNRHCCVENKPHGKMLTGHDKNNVKNQRQTEAESCTLTFVAGSSKLSGACFLSSSESKTRSDEVRDIGSPERTLLFIHRRMAAWYQGIIPSLCDWMMQLCRGFFFQSTFCKILKLKLCFSSVIDVFLWYFFLLSQMNMNASLV